MKFLPSPPRMPVIVSHAITGFIVRPIGGSRPVEGCVRMRFHFVRPRHRGGVSIRAIVLATSVIRPRSARMVERANSFAGDVETVVQILDLQRDGVGVDGVFGDDVHRAEFAHRAGVAEDDAVEQAPLDVGEGDFPEGLEAAGCLREIAACSSREPCSCMRGISSARVEGGR